MLEQDILKLKGLLARKEYEKAGYHLTEIILKAYQNRVLKSRIWIYVAKVEFDKKVTTARIHLKTGFVTFGDDFFVRHINSIDDLLFLMIHERNHYILEHSIWRSDLYCLRRSVSAPLVMLVEDAFINAAAYRTSPSRIADRFYKHTSLEVILTSDSKGVMKVFKDKEIANIHRQMWNVTKPLPDFGQFSDLLIRWFIQKEKEERQKHEKQSQEKARRNEAQTGPGNTDGKDQNDSVPSQSAKENKGVDKDQQSDQVKDQSGINTSQEDKNDDTDNASDLDDDSNLEEGETDGFKSDTENEAEAITPIVEVQDDIPVTSEDQKPTTSIVYSESGDLVYGRKIKALTPKSEIEKAFSTLTKKEREQFSVQRSFDISQIDTFISDFQCLRAGHDGLQGYTNTIPHRISKRDLNSIQMGDIPIMWNATYEGFEKYTKLYMDVSGSMDSYLGLIPYLFDRLMEHVDEIYEFSDVIVKVDPQDTYYYSTGGTSFNVVARHILDKDFQSVIVITDGCGNLSDDLIEKLSNQLEYFVYMIIDRKCYQKEIGWGKVANQIIHIDI